MAKRTINKKGKTAKEVKPMGRPTLYSVSVADKICLLISESSLGLHHICKNNIDLPCFSTIMKWLGDEDKKYFLDNYARAREAQAELLADEIIAIADDGSKDTEVRYTASGEPYDVEDKEWTSRSKLRVEARKWKASKLAPKKFGEKVDITTDGKEIKTFDIGATLATFMKNEGDA